MEIHHIGYLVKNIEKSTKIFENLGFKISKGTYRDYTRKIDICFMINNSYTIELISPYEIGSTVDNIIKKCGNSPYHICYKTSNIEEKAKELISEGYLQISNFDYAPAISENIKVVFFVN